MLGLAIRAIIYILLILIIIYILKHMLAPNTRSMPKAGEIPDITKSFNPITYAGGTTTIKEINVVGTLHISKELVVFDDHKKELFTIIIKRITNCSVVKIEEDSKQKSYVRIEYRTEDNSPRSVMLHSDFNEEYAQRIVAEINIRQTK